MKIYTTKTNARIAYLTAKLVKENTKDAFSRCIVFCEDKNTLSLEREIASAIGGSFNVNVMSFSRYISSRKANINALSKSGSALEIYKIIGEISPKLKKLRLTNRPTFASNLFELIAQLKSAKITPQNLKMLCNEPSDVFSMKLSDICEIFSSYEDYLKQNSLVDNSDYFELFPNIAKNDEKLQGAKVIFAGFSSVTKQIMEIFKCVNKICDCDFVLLKGDGELYTNEIFEKVKNVFPLANEITDDYVFSKESLAIEQGLFNADALLKDGLYSDKVHIFETINVQSEAEAVAKRIRYEVINNNKRYKDFIIECQNPNELSDAYQSVFSDYEIPLFVDIKSTMEKHPILRFILNAIEVIRLNYSIETIISFASQQLMFAEEESSLFIRYIKSNAISRKSIKQPFKIYQESDAICEQVRQKIISVCSLFQTKNTAEFFCESAKSALELADIKNQAEKLSKKLVELGLDAQASLNDLAWDRLNQMFFEVENVIGDKLLSISEFKTILLNAAAATEISVLPLFNDVVFMGDFKSAKQREGKIVFAVQMTSAVPNSKQDTALLNDRDLARMDSYQCVVEPKIKVVNKRERENVGVALMSFSEQLFVYYSSQDICGQISTPSEIIEYLCKIFAINTVNIQDEKSAKLYNPYSDVYNYMSYRVGLKQFALAANAFRERENGGEGTLSAFYYALKNSDKSCVELASILDEKREQKLSSSVVKDYSASVIENYYSCPYSNFVKHNLRLQEDEKGDVTLAEFGNIIHEVFEKFIAKISTVFDNNSCEKLSGDIFDEIIKQDKYSRYLNKAQYASLFKLVRAESNAKCYEVFCEYKNSKFLPEGEEVVFGDYENAKYPAIKIHTKKGDMLIKGKIDRIDRYKDYFRIIDYKTGNAEEKIKNERFYAGMNIQLYLYANAFMNEQSKLAGVYYYKVDNGFSKEETEQQNYIGKTLLSDEIAIASDTRLQTQEKSGKFNLRFKQKDDKRNLDAGKGTSLFMESEFNAYTEYAKRVSANAFEEMNEGLITPSPYAKSDKSLSCDYCAYSGMCGYDKEIDFRSRLFDDVSKDTIINAVEDKIDE